MVKKRRLGSVTINKKRKLGSYVKRKEREEEMEKGGELHESRERAYRVRDRFCRVRMGQNSEGSKEKFVLPVATSSS